MAISKIKLVFLVTVFFQFPNDMMTLEATSEKGEDLNDFCTFHHALLQIKSRPDGIYGLTNSERESFDNLIENNSSNAIAALGILNFLDKKAYQLQGRDYTMPDGTIRSFEIVSQDNPSIQKEELRIYPNPSNDLVNIEYALPEIYKEATLIISDLSGRMIHKKTLVSSKTILNSGTLENGVYLVQLYINNQLIQSKKLIYVR